MVSKKLCFTRHRPSEEHQHADDDRYRELPPVPATMEPPPRRKFTRSPMFSCIGKQGSEEAPMYDGMAANRNNSQVRIYLKSFNKLLFHL